MLLHPWELFQVRDEQRLRCAELPPEFPLCFHPHIFHILSMDLRVLRIHEVLLMDNHVVEIYASIELVQVMVCWPPIRHDVGAG